MLRAAHLFCNTDKIIYNNHFSKTSARILWLFFCSSFRTCCWTIRWRSLPPTCTRLSAHLRSCRSDLRDEEEEEDWRERREGWNQNWSLWRVSAAQRISVPSAQRNKLREEEPSTDFRLGLLHHGNWSPTTCSMWFYFPERWDKRRNLQSVWLGSCPSCFEAISLFSETFQLSNFGSFPRHVFFCSSSSSSWGQRGKFTFTFLQWCRGVSSAMWAAGARFVNW